MRAFAALALLSTVATVPVAWGQCPPSCPNPGGGSTTTDCQAEFAGAGLRNNYPSFDPAKPKPAKETRCFDGDPQCDLDGTTNGECVFDIDVCLRNPDPALPACTPSDVTSVAVGATSKPDFAALAAALNGLVPATSNVCTTGQVAHVPLKPSGTSFKAGKLSVSVKAKTALGTDADKAKLVCIPRDWPSHGHDYTNRRGTLDVVPSHHLNPTTAPSLAVKWQLALNDGGSNGVTATPTVGNGMVYVASWNGRVYGVNAKTGAIKWTYNTLSTFIGVQSSPTLTADGRLVFGDSSGVVHCILAKTGKLLWTNPIGNTQDHFWASAQVIGNRAYIGLASHTDNPCVPGRFFALDLDTGALVWEYDTVPAKICHNDTTLTCSTDADCDGSPGSCVAGCGAGVTATVASSPDGNTIYMATVGSYTFPSIGDDVSVLSLDAATGNLNWKHRLQGGEQFADGPPYHDWGFLNGPVLIDGDDGLGGTRPLLVVAGKEGALYALDLNGNLVWERDLLTPFPDFAAFGLFNGAIGWGNHRLYAALNAPDETVWPTSNDHLYAFSDLDGSTAWSKQIGESWAHIALADGLVFAGNNTTGDFFVHDADTGALLKTLALPVASSSGASIVDDVVYVGYGIFGGVGGVMAFSVP